MKEDRRYRVLKQGGTWSCAQVESVTCQVDFAYCAEVGKALNFTIRRFADGVQFLLYSPHMTPTQLKRQADHMSQHPAP